MDSNSSEMFFFGFMKSCLINGLDSNAVLLMPDFLMGTSLRILSSQPFFEAVIFRKLKKDFN